MAAGGGGRGWGGKRKRSSLTDKSAKVAELEAEVGRLSTQLRRCETDAIRAYKGEMSAERQQKDVLISDLRNAVSHSKSSRGEAQRAEKTARTDEATARTAEATARTAETDARNEHLVTLHDLTTVRLELEGEKHRVEVLEATVRSVRAEASADVAELSRRLTRAEKMIVYRNEKIAGMKAEALSVASLTEDAMSTMRATATAHSSCAAQVGTHATHPRHAHIRPPCLRPPHPLNADPNRPVLTVLRSWRSCRRLRTSAWRRYGAWRGG